MVSFKGFINKLRGKEESLSPLSLSEELNAQSPDTISNDIQEEGDNKMISEQRASGKLIGKGQLTLVDLTDIISQPTAPTPAKENMLWMDTSQTPPVLMVYKGGKWVKQNDFKEDPEYKVITDKITKNTQAIEINKGEILLKVSKTEATNIVIQELDKVNFGTRNLIKNSKIELTNNSYLMGRIYTTIDLIEGKKYTAVADVKTQGGQSVGLWMNDGSSRVGMFPVDKDGVAYFSFTMPKPGSEGHKRMISIYNYPSTGSAANPATVRWICLYEGEIKPPLDWTPAPEDDEMRFSQVNEQFAGIDTRLDKIDISVGNISTADFVKDVKNDTLLSLMGVGSNQPNKEINTKVKDSYAQMSLDGKTLVNIVNKGTYRFAADAVNNNKYTKNEAENAVFVSIKENLSSWFYVDAGEIKRHILKPNTKYTVFFEKYDGLKTVSFRSGNGTNVSSNSMSIESDGRVIITTNSSIPQGGTPIVVWCGVDSGANMTINISNCIVVEGEHERLTYFEDLLSAGEESDNFSVKAYRGSPNLFLNSDFHNITVDETLGWDKLKNGKLQAEYWGFCNMGVANPTEGYHAHLYRMPDGELVVRYMEQTGRWQSASQAMPTSMKRYIRKGKKYTLSMEIMSDTVGSEIFGGMHYSKQSGGSAGFHSGQYSFIVTEKNVWKKYSYTFTMPTDLRVDASIGFYNYGDKSKGYTYARHFKLEENDIVSPYCLSVEELADDKNEIRFYDGEKWIVPVMRGMNTVKDKIYKSDNGESFYTRRCGQINLTGTETGWIQEKTNDYNRFFIPIPDSVKELLRGEIVSNNFIYGNSGHNEFIGFTYNGNLFLYTSHADVNAFKAWLAISNVRVVYKLEEEENYACRPINMKSYPQGSFFVETIVPPTSYHSVPLNTLASIENAIASIEVTKNQIEQKVDVNGVIAAINIGVKDDESHALIMADKIKLKGAVTIEALSQNLAQIFEKGSDKTVIDGGYIKSGSIDLEGEIRTRKGITVTEGFTEGAKVTFNVTPEGNVYMAGTVESSNFREEKKDSSGNVIQKGSGWRIDQNGNAIFNQGEFRSKIILPRAGMSNEGNVRIWAGGDTPGTALFRVLDSGDCYIEKGHFKGVFSGSVEVGGISITDTGKNDGRGSIRITNNVERLVTEIADDVLTVGTDTYIKNKLVVSDDVKVSGTDFNFNDKIILKQSDSSISFNNDFANFKVNGTKFDFKVDDSSQSTDFEFSNIKRDTIVEIKGQLKVTSNVDIGVVTIRKMSDGIDFLFI